MSTNLIRRIKNACGEYQRLNTISPENNKYIISYINGKMIYGCNSGHTHSTSAFTQQQIADPKYRMEIEIVLGNYEKFHTDSDWKFTKINFFISGKPVTKYEKSYAVWDWLKHE